MGIYKLPRIGNRSDAVELLERLIEIAKTGAELNKTLAHGLESLKDVIVREAV